MTHLFNRRLTGGYPAVARGEGVYVIDSEGKSYLDASGGAAVSCLGHGDADVIQAIKDQIDRIAYIHSSFFTNSPAEALAEFLVAEAPGDLLRQWRLRGPSRRRSSSRASISSRPESRGAAGSSPGARAFTATPSAPLESAAISRAESSSPRF